MNDSVTHAPRAFGAVQREASQLAALTSIVRSSFSGVATSSDEVEVIELASDMAHRIYSDFLHATGWKLDGEAFAIAGKLNATLEVVCEMNSVAGGAKTDDERDQLSNRIGWLINSADDLGDELLGRIEQMGVEGGAA